MNEPAIKTEEQIISLFPDTETQVCRGWVLKRMEGQLLVYPLYYIFSDGDIPENIRRCEEIGRQCGAGCVFRIVEHTNYHLSSILTDSGYGLEKCGVVGECDLTGDTGELRMEGKMSEGLFLKNGNSGTGYVMAGESVIGIKRKGLLLLPDGNLSDTGLEDILRFAAANGIVRILADIPGGGRKNCRSNTGGWAFIEPISTVVIRKIRRRNPPEKRERKWIYRMKNVSW